MSSCRATGRLRWSDVDVWSDEFEERFPAIAAQQTLPDLLERVQHKAAEDAAFRQRLIDVIRSESDAIAIAKERLDGYVAVARAAGTSWNLIAKAAGMTPQAAMRRWDAEAREKRREYQRERRKKGSAST